MVSFHCESCNDVVKKPKLDAHKGRCRGAVFSCIDCSTTFQGTEYRSHTSCISEEQKYQGALYKPNEKKGKKGKQQQANGTATPAPVEEKKVEEKSAEGKEETVEEKKDEKKDEKKKDKKDKKKDKKEKKEAKTEKETKSSETPATASSDVEMADAPAQPTAAAAAPTPEKKSKKEKKDKKRKADTTEDTAAKKPKKAVDAEALKAAQALVEQIKLGRPVTLLKALQRVEREVGEGKFKKDEVFALLRLKKEKTGDVKISVVDSE